MARTIGGNPLRNLARRIGRRHPVTPTARPYTEADRRRLLAPISIGSFGGKSHAGSTAVRELHLFSKHQQRDRYGYAADWPDLDHLG